jgi:glycosyltransferase involved in cell wall biosynthesis
MSHNWRDVRCRLLYLVGQLRLGGLERQLYYLLANLDHVQYRPGVVVWNMNLWDKYYRDIEKLNVPIYGFAPEASPLSKLQAFRALARKAEPEVIHSYTFHTNFAAYYAARGTRALPIGSLRSDFATARKVGGSLRGALNARWPSHHISNSSACAEATRRAAGFFSPRHLSVVRNGLDLNAFSALNDSFEARTYVAAVGSLFPVKRWDRLLRVIHKAKNICAKEIVFRIAGEGPLRQTLEILAGELGICQSVKLLGATHNVPAFLKDAKFLVHTSESEGCPNVVMEAMACGLPVIAMEAGDIPCLVEEGKTGFVVRQGDEVTFCERVLQLLADNELCFSMGMAAREKAEREFRLERLVSETLAVYRAAGWND